MKKSFFTKIANFIDGTPDNRNQETQETVIQPTESRSEEISVDLETKEEPLPRPQEKKKQTQKNSRVIGKNSIDTEYKLITAIEKLFDSIYKGGKKETQGKIFTLWLTDNFLFEMVKGQNFQDELITKLDNGGYHTVWSAVKLKTPPRKHVFTVVSDNVFLQIEDQKAIKPAAKKARITIVEGKGSLLKEVYLLNSEDRKRYNIGVGTLPNIKGNGFRENHIAIDDNTTSSQYENNKYVSRAHAYIIFSEKDGFCLQVETGGSRVHGGRTRIFRSEKTIEVDNVENYEPLQHNDIIELGKSVCLRFEEIK